MATILVVEDRAEDRKLLSTLFAYRGDTVLEASDGAEALRVLEHTAPDLVISDILMPVVDGYELVRQLRTMPRFAETPVMFYTAAYRDREAHMLAQKCGVAEVLTKPSDPQIVLDKVDGLLQHARPIRCLPFTDFDRLHASILTAKLAEEVRVLEHQQETTAALVALFRRCAFEQEDLSLLGVICTELRTMLLAETGVLGVVADDGTGARTVTSSSMESERTGTVGADALAAEPLARVLLRRETMRMSDRSAASSFVAVPLATLTRVYGWLAFYNKLGADEFSVEDEQLATLAAVHAAIWYENTLRMQALRTADQRTEFALRAARMGIWEFDKSTGRVWWSDALAPVFGLTPDRAPKSLAEFMALVHPDDRQPLEAAVEQTLGEGAPFTVEFRTVLPDGSIRWIAGRARAVGGSGSQPRVLGIGVDVDQQKTMETQLRQAQKMDAIGQLAGGVAHDFNNLLTAILGYSEFLREESVTDKGRSDIEEIIAAGNRAAALTRQLLAVSRRQVLEPKPVDINALVENLSGMLRRLIGEQIQFTTVLGDDVAPVRADVGQIEQVVMNLALNARDAMTSGGRLTIRTCNTVLEEGSTLLQRPVRPGAYTMVAVADTGVGMTEEVKARIFEPFFTTKPRDKGTGLGLATVYGIVEQTGGYVSVETAVGRGTTFNVYLPHATGPVEHHRPSLKPASARGSETVLVVEDDEIVRKLMERAFAKAGFQVLLAANPDEALQIVRTRPHIALLVSDVVLPGNTGPELARKLSTDQAEMRVLYVSGYANDSLPECLQLEPGSAFLQKPFTGDALARKAREILDA